MLHQFVKFQKLSTKIHFLNGMLFLVFMNLGYSQNIPKEFLNGSWNFKIYPYSQGEKSGWQNENLDTASWDKMKVPGNWDLVNEYAEYAGDAWYSRTFKVDKSVENQQIRLIFQSVYNDAKVWINGNFVGENHFGYLPFHFNISNYIKFGEENRITVLANNVFRKGAFWSWGGIRRPVWLEITPTTRIEFQHIDAVPDLKKGTANVTLKIVTSNVSNEPKKIRFNINITRENNIVAEGQLEATIPPKTLKYEVKWTHNLSKSQVALWHFDFPNLYESTVSISENNKVLHSISDRFGIRKLEIEGLHLKLNGESIRPVGFNLVPEDRFTGNTLPFERIKEDVDLMKSLGATMSRLSHVTLPKEYLDYLDEKGIMVIEEVGLWGKDAWVDPNHPMPKEWLQRIVEYHYNHPSVVGWSMGNEIGKEIDNPKVKEYVKSAIEMSKKIDSNRLAIYVSNSAQNNPEDAIQFANISAINLYGNWESGVDKAWNYHKKPVFVSEFGHNLNSENPNLGKIPIEKMMNAMRNKRYVLGASIWTLNDYRSTYYGLSGWNTPPSQNRTWGVVTTFRRKKRAFFELQKEFAPISSLKISNLDKTKGKAEIMIQPRGKFDIPANVLINYQIKKYLIDENFNEKEEENTVLKTIFPGDDSLSIPFQWDVKKITNGIKVVFLDPQGYVLLEETLFFSYPKKPTIKKIYTSSKEFRILFDNSTTGNEYYLKYQQDDSIYTSAKTINNFIDIKNNKLVPSKPIQVQLFSENNFGKSDSSDSLKIKLNESELPPVIWDIKRVKESLFIGYTVLPTDYLFEVEYGFEPNNYNHKVTTKVKGVLNIPNLPQEKTVYFRMRAIKQWGFASEWTAEVVSKINQ